MQDEVEPFHPHATPEIPPKVHLEKALSDAMLYALPPKVPFPSDSASVSFQSLSSGGSDGMNGRIKGAGTDAFRVSLSSAVSSSSQGSGHDDGDALGDVFMWGKGVGDCILGGGLHRVGSSSSSKMDFFLPKVLESAVVMFKV
jgi:hypothetical protein